MTTMVSRGGDRNAEQRIPPARVRDEGAETAPSSRTRAQKGLPVDRRKRDPGAGLEAAADGEGGPGDVGGLVERHGVDAAFQGVGHEGGDLGGVALVLPPPALLA